jgi:hypothetical protein
MFNFDWFKKVLVMRREWMNSFQGNSLLGKSLELATNLSKLSAGETSMPPIFKSLGLGDWFGNSSLLAAKSIGPAIKKTMMNSIFSAALPVLMISIMGFSF